MSCWDTLSWKAVTLKRTARSLEKLYFMPEDPALSPQSIYHFFVLAVNRGQATLSGCNPCLHSGGCRSSTRQTWLKGRPWSSCLLPQALPSPPSSLPASRKGSCVSVARLQVFSSVHTCYLGCSPNQQSGSLP